jgi:predicted esterase
MNSMAMIERSIETITHGRYLVEASKAGLPVLVGFHGYAESAEIQFNRLRSIEGSDRWVLLSIQGLHRFYRGRSTDVVASWMTRQDRDLAITDNTLYAAKVISAVAKEHSCANNLVLSGFSQGVAMAFRAAAGVGRPVDGIIALGGDVPPELDARRLSNIGRALIGRGNNDEWYTAEKLAADERRLREARIHVDVFSFNAAHEWTAEFNHAASRFLNSIYLR